MSHNVKTTASYSEGSIRLYVTGFVLSILLTIAPYYLVTEKVLDGMSLLLTLAGFAVGQIIVQLFFFLHFGKGPGARWNVIVFLFMLLIVFIVVAGSIWIMDNLNYNMMMTPEQMDEHMRYQGQKGF